MCSFDRKNSNYVTCTLFQVKVLNAKIDYSSVGSKVGSKDKIDHKPKGGDKKVRKDLFSLLYNRPTNRIQSFIIQIHNISKMVIITHKHNLQWIFQESQYSWSAGILVCVRSPFQYLMAVKLCVHSHYPMYMQLFLAHLLCVFVHSLELYGLGHTLMVMSVCQDA